MFCKMCGTQLDENTKFCSNCGHLVDENTNLSQDNNDNHTPPTPPSITTHSKNNSLTNWALILSSFSAVFPLTEILNTISHDAFGVIFLILACLCSLPAMIPALIVSIIAVIRAIVHYKKTHCKCYGFTTSIVALCLSLILPITLLVIAMPNKDEDYSHAMDLYNQKSYTEAYDAFVSLDNYKDSSAMAAECRYLLAVDLAEQKDWKEAKEIFDEMAANNYKASNSLAAYCNVWHNTTIHGNMAENKVIGMLKDPSSYQLLKRTIHYELTDRSETAIDMHLTIEIKYSATNSFGGRVSDTYETEADVVLSNTYGFTADQLTKLLKKSISSIVSDCD